MSDKKDKKKRKIEIQDGEREQPTEVVEEQAAPPHDDAPEPAEAPETAGSIGGESGETSEVEKLKAELADTHARLLRVSADYQNFVRRSHQNIETTREQTIMSIARSLLTVMDHFDHALAVDPEKTDTTALLSGVQIVRDELMRALEGCGVKRLEVAPGDAFDPNQHEAMLRQPSEEIDPDHVVAQLQPGYLLGEKTLRPAKVSVAGEG